MQQREQYGPWMQRQKTKISANRVHGQHGGIVSGALLRISTQRNISNWEKLCETRWGSDGARRKQGGYDWFTSIWTNELSALIRAIARRRCRRRRRCFIASSPPPPQSFDAESRHHSRRVALEWNVVDLATGGTRGAARRAARPFFRSSVCLSRCVAVYVRVHCRRPAAAAAVI